MEAVAIDAYAAQAKSSQGVMPRRRQSLGIGPALELQDLRGVVGMDLVPLPRQCWKTLILEDIITLGPPASAVL